MDVMNLDGRCSAAAGGGAGVEAGAAGGAAGGAQDHPYPLGAKSIARAEAAAPPEEAGTTASSGPVPRLFGGLESSVNAASMGKAELSTQASPAIRTASLQLQQGAYGHHRRRTGTGAAGAAAAASPLPPLPPLSDASAAASARSSCNEVFNSFNTMAAVAACLDVQDYPYPPATAQAEAAAPAANGSLVLQSNKLCASRVCSHLPMSNNTQRPTASACKASLLPFSSTATVPGVEVSGASAPWQQ